MLLSIIMERGYAVKYAPRLAMEEILIKNRSRKSAMGDVTELMA